MADNVATRTEQLQYFTKYKIREHPERNTPCRVRFKEECFSVAKMYLNLYEIR